MMTVQRRGDPILRIGSRPIVHSTVDRCVVGLSPVSDDRPIARSILLRRNEGRRYDGRARCRGRRTAGLVGT